MRTIVSGVTHNNRTSESPPVPSLIAALPWALRSGGAGVLIVLAAHQQSSTVQPPEWYRNDL